VAAAITLGYEISGVVRNEAVRAAMVAGKLLGLDEDRLANAVGIALIPHVALNKGVGALSMWKGVRTAEATKCGVWSALAAYEGMTGPPQPYEGRGSLWSETGAARPYTLPVSPGQFGIETTWAKRFPADAQTHGVLMLMPEVRAWTKVDEIAAIQYELVVGSWQEVGSNPKWDPRNRETADHSIPWVVARSLIDGREIFLDSYGPDKYPFRDPVVKALMDKITLTPVAAGGRLTVRKKSGETKSWETYGGVKNPGLAEQRKMMSEQDIENKFKRCFDFRQVATAQRDQAHAVWSNLMAVKDIAEPMRALAAFGKPQPL
jgi:2-methylcitrate dehydratase